MKALKMKKYSLDKSKQGKRPVSSTSKRLSRTDGKPSVRAKKEDTFFSTERKHPSSRAQVFDKSSSRERKNLTFLEGGKNKKPALFQEIDKSKARNKKESSFFSEDKNRKPSHSSLRSRKKAPSFTEEKKRKPSHLNTTMRSNIRDKQEYLPVTALSLVKKKPKTPRLEGALLWGVHAVSEAWLNPKRTCVSLRLSDSGFTALQEIFKKAEALGLSRPEPLRVERSEIDMFLPRGTVHQGILLQAEPLADITLDDLLGAEKSPSLILILDQVTDPHNIGAILRSAAAFGADAVIITERNAPGMTGILAKTASGAVEHVPLISVVNLARTIEMLQAESFWCVGLAEEGDKDLSASQLSSGKIALILGAEGDGLRRLTREHCDELARLPTRGPIGSLNVSNAAVISLYEVIRQRG